MFKEILKIFPQLDKADLNKMDRTLSQRFGSLAKKFGKGLKTTLLGGGIAGIALGLIDKILNPLKETQDAIDRVLKSGDDVVTNAKQFNTTAGKLFKLQGLAKSTGLDAGNLDLLLTKFQTAVAEAVADPTKKTSVRQFTGETDTVEGFFKFIQAVQRMDKNQQILVQQEVFGEKQILKMADFLQTNFRAQSQILGAKGSEEYTPSLEKLGGLNDFKDALEAKREMEDTVKKAGLINTGMIRNNDMLERQNLQRENQKITAYQSIAKISEQVNKAILFMEKGYTLLGRGIEILEIIVGYIKKTSYGRLIKGITSGKED